MKVFILGMLSLVFLAGCQVSEEVVEDGAVTQEVELGAYAFGPLLDVEMNELIRFEFIGEEIRIPYHVEGQARGIVSEFGWFALVDGLPQSTRLETLDGSVLSEESFMHIFQLEFMERKEFYVVFTPEVENKEGSVGFIAGGILSPTFLPKSTDNPSFGGMHHLTATIPAEIKMLTSTSSSLVAYRQDNLVEINEDILSQLEERLISEVAILEVLNYFPFLAILPIEDDLQINRQVVLESSNNSVDVRLIVLGGQEVLNRITFFVNHQPVTINGVADYVEIFLNSGRMGIIDINLDVEILNELNSLYAIMMTAGEDYLIQDIFKSSSVLLIQN
ncbi:MAG: hypothetical protein FWF59_04135 [Turicibacter sp.]|nr:hypothetical protein [Turicibacter sp.]